MQSRSRNHQSEAVCIRRAISQYEQREQEIREKDNQHSCFGLSQLIKRKMQRGKSSSGFTL